MEYASPLEGARGSFYSGVLIKLEGVRATFRHDELRDAEGHQVYIIFMLVATPHVFLGRGLGLGLGCTVVFYFEVGGRACYVPSRRAARRRGASGTYYYNVSSHTPRMRGGGVGVRVRVHRSLLFLDGGRACHVPSRRATG